MQQKRKKRIGIVASLFNEEYVNAMLESALEELDDQAEVIVWRVPGSFEIPLAIQRIIEREEVEVAIAFGVIWQGKTMHAELLAHSVTHALMQISLEQDTPVIHQVLTVKTESEARARCMGKTLNRGREAAEAALMLCSIESNNRK